MIYNYAVGRWSIANVENDLVAPFFTAGYTLEALDNLASSIDALPASLDSALFKGGSYLFGGSLNNKIYSFSGAKLEGLIETSELSLSQGRHTVVTRTVPYFRKGSVTMQIGIRDRQDDAVVYDSGSALTDEGFCEHRQQGRFHRARMNLTGEWEFAQGLDIEGRPLGRR